MLSEPKDKETAKVFCMIDHDYMKKMTKKAKGLIKDMDIPMRVLVGHLLRKDGYLPVQERELYNEVCDSCQATRDNDKSWDCTCNTPIVKCFRL